MLNITRSYAKVWETEDMGKYVKGKVQSSEKNKVTGDWDNSSWFARFVGKAVGMGKTLSKGDKIVITKAKIENIYNKEKEKAFLSLVIFEFEYGETAARQEYTGTDDQNDDYDDPLPF